MIRGCVIFEFIITKRQKIKGCINNFCWLHFKSLWLGELQQSSVSVRKEEKKSDYSLL